MTGVALQLWRAFRTGEMGRVTINITHFAVRFHAPLDVEALQGATRSLLRRHELLCASIDDSSDIPIINYRNFEENCEYKLPNIIDVSDALPEGPEREYKIKSNVEEIIWDGDHFVSQGNFFYKIYESYLLKIGENDHIFIFMVHHSLADATSIAIAYAEFVESYRLLKGGAGLPDGGRTIQYHDHALSMLEWLSADGGQGALSYWSANASIPRPFIPPADLKRGEVLRTERKLEVFEMSGEELFTLREFCTANKISVSYIFMIAEFLAISKSSQIKDGVINVLHHGRDQISLSKSFGPYLSIMPLRISIEGRKKLSELMKSEYKNWISLLSSSPVHLDDLFFGNSNSSVGSIFNYVDMSFKDSGSENSDESNYYVPMPTRTVNSDIDLDDRCWRNALEFLIFDYPDRIIARMTYSMELYKDGTVKKLLNDVVGLIRAVVEGKDLTLDELLA